jgi:hypothetical protein
MAKTTYPLLGCATSIGMAAESVEGTPVAATLFYDLMSEDMVITPEYANARPISNGSRQWKKGKRYLRNVRAGGGFKCVPRSVHAAQLLAAILHNTIASGPAEQGWGNFYTGELIRGVAGSTNVGVEQYTTCKCNQLIIDSQENGELTMAPSFLAHSGLTAFSGPASPSYTAWETKVPFLHDNLVITGGPSWLPADMIYGVTVTLKNNIPDNKPGNNAHRRVMPLGLFDMDIKINIPWSESTEDAVGVFTAGSSNLTTGMVLTWTANTSDSIALTCQVQWEGNPKKVDGPDHQELEVTGVGIKDGATQCISAVVA